MTDASQENTATAPKGFRRYLGNSAWIMSDSVVTNGFSFLVLIIVARIFGPDDYGAYAYVFSFAALFATIGHMGLDGLMTRELVSKPDCQAETLGTAGGLRVAGYVVGALACLIYGLAKDGHSPTERALFVSAAIFILLTPGPLIIENWFRARVEARYASMARIAGTLIGGGMKVVLVLAGFSVASIGWAQTLTVAVILALSLVFFLRRGAPPPWTWRFSGARALELLKESWLIFFGSIMVVIYLTIDQVMLRWMVEDGTEAVGVYAIAARLSEVFYFIPAALVATFFPRLITLHDTDRAHFNDRFQSFLSLLTLLAYGVMLSLLVLAPLLLVPVFGEDYARAVPVLLIHMCAMPFIFMRYAFSRWIIIEKFAVFSAVSQGAGAVMNVGLNLWLIPAYGIIGAAIATVISYAFAGYLVLLVSDRTRPVFGFMTRALGMPWTAIHAVTALRKGEGSSA